MEKKLERMEGARTTEVAALALELEASRTAIKDQVKDRDTKINVLVEELGNTQVKKNTVPPFKICMKAPSAVQFGQSLTHLARLGLGLGPIP